ncbi:hypothetical protein [Nannocystis pusilla]|uniref:hypothetical protein n=1 Tax=Nannocystis pusilla TaxID=889268 RepID=UPI003BF1A40A
MSRRANPFIVGNSVGNTPAFVGREDMFTRVDLLLGSPTEVGILLFGQRRIGKSSLLHQLHSRLPAMGPWRPIYFDLHGRATMTAAQLLGDLAEVIARTAKFPAFTGREASIGAFRGWLREGLRSLPEGHRLVFLFDEFDVLSAPDGERRSHELYSVLTDILQGETGGQLAAVYAAGRTMNDLDSAARPLLRGVPVIHVSTLSRLEFDQLLDLGERDGSLVWGDGARDVLWDLTCGHPLLTQLLGSRAWQAVQRSHNPVVSAAMVHELVPGALKESHGMLSWLWDGITPACRVVAAAIAEHKSRAVTVDEMATVLRDSGVRIIISQLSAAPQLLREWDLLEETDGKYSFKVELLRLWVRKCQPFSAVRECLDELVPRANDFFRRASEMWQGAGDLDPKRVAAIAALLESIFNDPRMNPNHVGAALLLADVYVHQGRRDDAIHLLASLYPIQPIAIGPRYVQLLLQSVERPTAPQTEDERLAIYEKILEAAPRTHEAVVGRATILRERGQRHLAAGQLREARDCFVRAGDAEQVLQLDAELERRQLEQLLGDVQELEHAGRPAEALARLMGAPPPLAERPECVAMRERLTRRQAAEDTLETAVVALHNHDRETAIERLCQVLQLDPGHPRATRELAGLLRPPERRRLRDRWAPYLVFFSLWVATLGAIPLIIRSSYPLPVAQEVFTSDKCEAPVFPGWMFAQQAEVTPATVVATPAAPPPAAEVAAPAPERPAAKRVRRSRPEAPSPSALAQCERGNAWSCYGIGMLYLESAPATAIHYLMNPCDRRNIADACCRLAELYAEDGPFHDPISMQTYRDKAHANGMRTCLADAAPTVAPPAGDAKAPETAPTPTPAPVPDPK